APPPDRAAEHLRQHLHQRPRRQPVQRRDAPSAGRDDRSLILATDHSLANELIDEWQGLANLRTPWESYWRQIAMYVLPQTQTFDLMLNTAADSAVHSVVTTPVASRRSKDLYD